MAITSNQTKASLKSSPKTASTQNQTSASAAAAASAATSGPSISTSLANTRAILSTFDKYQKDRLAFVQSVADYAGRENNVEILQQAGVMALLKPLLNDPVPAIQQASAVALGRLANYNAAVAQSVVNSDILPHLIHSLKEQNRFYKKSAAFVLRSIARHSSQLAQTVVDCGALQSLIHCLEEFDPSVKESAAWAIGYIARHNADLAQSVVDAGAVPLLGLCLQEPELALKRIAASALADIASHTPSLATAVVDAQTLPHLCSHLHLSPQTMSQWHGDVKLLRQAVRCLSAISKHSTELAEAVVDGDIFPGIWGCFKVSDVMTRKQSADLVCSIVKHSTELAQLVVHSGGCAVLVDYLEGVKGGLKVPGIMALGYIAAFNDMLALAVIVAKSVPVLIQSLAEQSPASAKLQQQQQQQSEEGVEIVAADYVKATACWTLGQIGRHSPEHAKHLTDHAVLPKLLKVLVECKATNDEGDVGADLKAKSKKALKAILLNTLDSNALEPLLQTSTPPNILKYVLGQFAKILPQNVSARRAFVMSGGLGHVQEIAALYAVGPVSSMSAPAIIKPPGPGNPPQASINTQQVSKDADKSAYVGAKLAESIRTINECYPEEIVRYYSPGYATTLLAKIDEFGKSQIGGNGAAALASLPESFNDKKHADPKSEVTA